MFKIYNKIQKLIFVFKNLYRDSRFNSHYYQTRMIIENKILLKKISHHIINVVFIVFEPETWLMFQSLYDTFSNSEKINLTIIVIPYAHSTLPVGTYKDAGMREYLSSKHIPYIYGYDKDTDTWIDIFSLRPDYVFYQAPYNGMYPDVLKSNYVSQFAQICYVPYGAFLQTFELEQVVHPKDFFHDVTFFFLPTKAHKKIFVESSISRHLHIDQNNIIVSGLTKIEHSINHNEQNEQKKSNIKILWTPRWTTQEGVCTFFDYYDFLIDITTKHENISLILRPHPLMFQNFLHTKELTEQDIEKIYKDFNVKNRRIDCEGDYTPTFKEVDVLISDLSSMIYEFFLYEKPIIYTHKKNFFNEFGNMLLKECYWANNSQDIDTFITNLIDNNDYKKDDRIQFINNYIQQTMLPSHIIYQTLTQ